MSTIMIFFLALGAVATLIFVAGYIRGVRAAIMTYDDDHIETDTSGDVDIYWWKIGVGVLAASLVIYLAGVAPAFIYLGPFLAIMTAAMNGVAFFIETPPAQGQ